jgi:hypothetical protein
MARGSFRTFWTVRPVLRSVARLMAMVLVFAQLAVSAYACPRLQPVSSAPESPASAPMVMSEDGSDCAGRMALDPASPTLCAEHCKVGQQSERAWTVSVPPALLNALYPLAPPRATSPVPRSTAAPPDALVAASPPHAVLHCVYRI